MSRLSAAAPEGPSWRDHHAQLDELIASLHARAWMAAAGSSPQEARAVAAETPSCKGELSEPRCAQRGAPRGPPLPGPGPLVSPGTSPLWCQGQSGTLTPREAQRRQLVSSPEVRPILLGGRRPQPGSLKEVASPRPSPQASDAGELQWTARFDEEWDLVQTAVSITENLNLLQDWGTQLASPPAVPTEEVDKTTFLSALHELHREQRAQLEGLQEDFQRQKEVHSAEMQVTERSEPISLEPIQPTTSSKTTGASSGSTLWRSFRDAMGFERRKVELLSWTLSMWKTKTLDAGLRRASGEASSQLLGTSFQAWRSCRGRDGKARCDEALSRIICRKDGAASLQGLRAVVRAWQCQARFRWRSIHSIEVTRAFHSWRFYARFRPAKDGPSGLEMPSMSTRSAAYPTRPQEQTAGRLALASAFLAWRYATSAGAAVLDLRCVIRHRRRMRQRIVQMLATVDDARTAGFREKGRFCHLLVL